MAPPGAPTPLAGPLPATAWGEARALAVLAGPLVGSNLLQMATYAIDVVFAARLGSVDFAAATIGVFCYGTMLWAIAGLVSAAAPLIAAELGRRRHAVRDVRRSFRMAMWLGVLVGVPSMLVLANGESLLRVAGQDAAVARRAALFLDVLLWALVPGVAGSLMRTVAAALGRPNWALAINVVALLVGLLANWMLVFGHGGAPALGLVGSALASLASALALFAAYACVLVLDPRLRRYRLFGRWWRPEWQRLAQIVRLGVPIAVTYTFEGALFGGASLLMGLIGVAAIDAHAVALNIAAICFQVPFGVAQAATIRVGTAFGAGDRAAVARAGWVAVAAGTGFMALTATAIVVAPRLFISAYLDVDSAANAPVVALALRFLAVAALFQLFDGAQAVLAGALRGIQDTRVPMIVAGFGYWGVGFVVSVLLGFRAGWGGVGVWLGLAAGLAVVSVLLGWRWARRDALGLTAGTA